MPQIQCTDMVLNVRIPTAKMAGPPAEGSGYGLGRSNFRL